MNMKPPEVLSLLEEASGTKLYERKKDAALKTLCKKEARLDEIDQARGEPQAPSWLGLGSRRGQDNTSLIPAPGPRPPLVLTLGHEAERMQRGRPLQRVQGNPGAAAAAGGSRPVPPVPGDCDRS